MFDLVAEAQGPVLPELTEHRIFKAFARYLGPDQVLEMRAMAVEGKDVPLPKTLGNCAQLEQVTRPVLDLGFDEKSLETNHIAGVDPAGLAYRAGIRDGQQVFRYSIYHDDPSKDVVLGVIIDGKSQMIHYSGAKQAEFAQYRATAQGTSAEACTPF